MSKSTNPTIQSLMDDVASLDINDDSIEAKLALIAQKVAEEQQKMQASLTGRQFVPVIAGDPADAFACEGCQ